MFDQHYSLHSVQQQAGRRQHPKAALHAPQQRSFFMLNGPNLHTLHRRNTRICISVLIPDPHSKQKKVISKPHKKSLTHPPSHAFHSQISTPPVAQRVSRFTRNNGRLGALHPRKRQPRTRACEGPGPPSWLAKKGVCGSGAGVLVMGCIRHCAILESNAGTVSWD
jgi:hypothetical protein